MLIQPDTIIKLLHNCPLDKTYDHTLYFDDDASQYSYFNTLTKHNLTKQSYQRYDRGWLTIQVAADELYDCNYLMFRNNAFGTKWFYAFITSIEYVNNVSSRIKYELDVMQTWYFEYNLGECFVEREHSETDNIGDNLIPENIETGDYFIKKLDVPYCPFPAGQYSVIVAQGTNKLGVEGEGDTVYDCVVSNVFSGIDYTKYNTPSEAYSVLKEINESGKSDSVVSVFMVPSIFWGGASTTYFSETNVILDVNGLSNPYDDSFDGFTPDNNKLFTAPYFGLVATSSSGAERKYAYEYFEDPSNPIFGIEFSVGATAEATLTPSKYKGTSGENLNEALTCTDFPQCAYATDTFKAYIAQNSGRLISSINSSIMRTGFRQGSFENSTYIPGVTGAQTSQLSAVGSASLSSAILDTMTQLYDVSVLPPKVRGSGASYINYTKNRVGFIFYKYKIRREFAEIIDEYFNMFGYATRRVKIPNISSRPCWNYVKTRGCVITGSIPADDTAKICSIYDRGITFWKRGSEIGQYSLNNKPE